MPEDELQVRVDAQSGQGVGQRGEDEDTHNHAGDLADAAGEGDAAHNAGRDGVHFPALAVSGGAGTHHADAFQPGAEAVQDTCQDERTHSDTEDGDTGDGSSLRVAADGEQVFAKVVLFQMNQTMMTAAMAHRMMVGKPPSLGMIMLGMSVSMPPKETPLVE